VTIAMAAKAGPLLSVDARSRGRRLVIDFGVVDVAHHPAREAR
jgi:hypothetical protein